MQCAVLTEQEAGVAMPPLTRMTRGLTYFFTPGTSFLCHLKLESRGQIHCLLKDFMPNLTSVIEPAAQGRDQCLLGTA